MKPLRYLSVCSGIEAATVAWHPLGFVPVAFSEIESFPCAVLQHHYPTVPNLGDMTQFKEWPDYAIELLVGGTPCQSFSVAGLRKGLADPRGNLALTFLAIVDRYRPRWVVWENVPGVHSSWSDVTVRRATERADEVERSVRELALEAGLDGETIEGCGGFEEADQSSDFDGFLAGLEELGYGVASTILDAQFFGVAQRRERVFVVGHAGGEWQRAAAVLFERAGLCGHPAPSRATREGVAPTLSARPEGGGGLGTDFDLDGGLVESSVTARTLLGKENSSHAEDQGTYVTGVIPIQEIGKRTGRSTDDVACGIGIGEQHDPMFTLQQGAVHGVCATLTKNYATHHGRSAGNNGGVADNQLIAFDPTQVTSKTNRSNPQHGDPCHTLAKNSQAPIIGLSAKDDGRDATENLSPTLRSCNHDQSHANAGWNVAVAHSLRGDGFDAIEDGTGRGTPLVPEIVGTLSDGAHMGGGLNGQDAYSGRIIPAIRGVGIAGAGQQRDGQRHERGAPDTDASRRFL